MRDCSRKGRKVRKGGRGRRGEERMIFNFGFWIEEEMLTQRTRGSERGKEIFNL